MNSIRKKEKMLLGVPFHEKKHRLQICRLARIPAEQTLDTIFLVSMTKMSASNKKNSETCQGHTEPLLRHFKA